MSCVLRDLVDLDLGFDPMEMSLSSLDFFLLDAIFDLVFLLGAPTPLIRSRALTTSPRIVFSSNLDERLPLAVLVLVVDEGDVFLPLGLPAFEGTVGKIFSLSCFKSRCLCSRSLALKIAASAVVAARNAFP